MIWFVPKGPCGRLPAKGSSGLLVWALNGEVTLIVAVAVDRMVVDDVECVGDGDRGREQLADFEDLGGDTAEGAGEATALEGARTASGPNEAAQSGGNGEGRQTLPGSAGHGGSGLELSVVRGGCSKRRDVGTQMPKRRERAVSCARGTWGC